MKEFSIFPFLTILILDGTIATNIFKPEIKNHEEIQNCRFQNDSNQIKILSNYNKINSVTELLDSFSSKPVFIDMWAT